MEDAFDSDTLRATIEEALGFFVKLPQRKPASGDAFLEIPGPDGKAIAFAESEGRVDLLFGPARGSFDFSGSWIEDEDGDEGASLDAEAAEAELHEDFREEMEAMVNLALDILDESVFAARYSEDGAPMDGMFPAEEFEAMRGRPGFSSLSWKGRFDTGPLPGSATP